MDRRRFEKVSKSSDFPTIILDVPKKFSKLLACHVDVMDAVRGMIREGGAKEALAAIYALRQRNLISGKLASCMDEFTSAASLVHGFFQLEFTKAVENGRRIKGQTPAMQRLYYESFKACETIRNSILTEWHELSLKVTDTNLAEEAKRIDVMGREAYWKLLGEPLPLAITASAGSEPINRCQRCQRPRRGYQKKVTSQKTSLARVSNLP